MTKKTHTRVPQTIVMCVLRDPTITSWCGRKIHQEAYYNIDTALGVLDKGTRLDSVCSKCCDEMEKTLVKAREARGPTKQTAKEREAQHNCPPGMYPCSYCGKPIVRKDALCSSCLS